MVAKIQRKPFWLAIQLYPQNDWAVGFDKKKRRALKIALRGAWRDRDQNDTFAHCALIFYFLDFKFSNFVCLPELHPLIWLFLKNQENEVYIVRQG